jgi:hypothetical protein
MHLPQFDTELAYGVDYQSRQHRGAVRMVQPVQCPAQAVILQQANLIGLQAEVFRNASSQPVGIQWAARQQQVGNQDAERNGSGDIFRPPGGRRQVACEERLEFEAFQEAADDRYSADFEGFKRGVVEDGSHQCLSV